MYNSKFDCLNPTSQWICFRSGNLVYLVMLKCASSMYREIFSRLGWKQTSLDTVDWERDKVFSYMRDPMKRRISAVAEYAAMQSPYTGTDIVTDEKYMQMMNDMFVLDHHTVSCYDILGSKAELVDWIPIDTNIDHIKMTQIFLKAHGHDVDLGFAYSIDPAGRNVTLGGPRKVVKEYLETLPQHSFVISYLDYDMVLYQHVNAFFDPNGGVWDSISWLKIHKT